MLFLSPPQEKGAYDPRKVDVWAIGVLLHFLTVGGFPYDGCADIAHARRKYAWDLMPKGLVVILEKVLSEDPAKRYDMEGLEGALENYGKEVMQMSFEEKNNLVEKHMNPQREAHRNAYSAEVL